MPRQDHFQDITVAGNISVSATTKILPSIPDLIIDNPTAGVNSFQVFSSGGFGRLLRFAIENNVVETVDVDFRNVNIAYGETDGPGVTTQYLANTSYSPITIRRVGSSTVNNWRLNSSGTIVSSVGGVASTAWQIDVAGDANARFLVDEFGDLNWGAGGASALDVKLERPAADTLQLATGDSFNPQTTGQTLGASGNQWRVFNEVVLTASLPAATAARDGTLLIEDAGAGDRNLIIYAGGERFRIDGGAAF